MFVRESVCLDSPSASSSSLLFWMDIGGQPAQVGILPQGLGLWPQGTMCNMSCYVGIYRNLEPDRSTM